MNLQTDLSGNTCGCWANSREAEPLCEGGDFDNDPIGCVREIPGMCHWGPSERPECVAMLPDDLLTDPIYEEEGYVYDPWRDVKDAVNTLNWIGQDPSGFMDNVRSELIAQMYNDLYNTDMQLNEAKCAILNEFGMECNRDYTMMYVEEPMALWQKHNEGEYQRVQAIKDKIAEKQGLNLQTCQDSAEGGTDSGGDGCDWYVNNSDSCYTGNYDDDDFVA